MLQFTKQEIIELYEVQSLSTEEIALIVGIEQAFVDNVIAEYEKLKAWTHVEV